MKCGEYILRLSHCIVDCASARRLLFSDNNGGRCSVYDSILCIMYCILPLNCLHRFSIHICQQYGLFTETITLPYLYLFYLGMCEMEIRVSFLA